VTVLLYDGSGRPAVLDKRDHEVMRALMLDAFGVISGAMEAVGEAELRGGMEKVAQAWLARVVEILGAEAVEARFPGLKVQEGAPDHV